MPRASGFPQAPLAIIDGDDQRAVRAFDPWRLERVTGRDFRDVVEQRVTEPAESAAVA